MTRGPTPPALLICARCTARAGGGFGPGRRWSLARALRRHLSPRRWWWPFGPKPAPIAEVACLAVCPRGAVTVRRPDERASLTVPLGADIGAVADRLGLTATAHPPT